MRLTKHQIDFTPGAKAVYQPPYRAGHKSEEVKIDEVSRMLRKRVIGPATSEWAIPVELAQKKNDAILKLCIGYRNLYGAIVRYSYPMPRMEEWIYFFGDTNVFGTLDSKSACWQIPTGDKDKAKIRFTCHRGLNRLTHMPFGLRNEEYKAFTQLEPAMVSPPIMALPKSGLPSTGDTDTSDSQVGRSLLQEQENGYK